MSNFISKLLNNFRTSEKEGPAAEEAVVASADANIDLVGFVQHVVSSLVDADAQWAVEAEEDEGRLTLKISCQEGQVGRIIGKNGKTIEAIRLLMRDAASRVKKKAKVVVVQES